MSADIANYFQLPLSGSLMVMRVKSPEVMDLLSTPSLGITQFAPRYLLWKTCRHLSTPSLGITIAETDDRRDVSSSLRLSTPSLGITGYR